MCTSNVIIKVTCLSPLSFVSTVVLVAKCYMQNSPWNYLHPDFIVLNCVCCQRKCLGWLALFITMAHNSIVPNMSSVFCVNFRTAQKEYLKKLQQCLVNRFCC